MIVQEEYVDSYSKTALQQADIIMDGIRPEIAKKWPGCFVHIFTKIIQKLQTDIKHG